MGQEGDLEETIAYHHEWLYLCAPGHPDRASSLRNLAYFIQTHFEQTGQAKDLKTAIACYQESLDLCPLGHPDHSILLNNLAESILSCFYYYTGEIEYLDDAADYFFLAEASLPINHPMHPDIWSRLAVISLRRHSLHQSDEHLSNALALSECSVNYHKASVMTGLLVAFKWLYTAETHKRESTLRAYSIMLILLDRFVTSVSSVQFQRMPLLSSHTKSVAMDAASWAIDAGQPETAVEFLEQGRAIILSAMRTRRHTLERLRVVDPDLAGEFETLDSEIQRYNIAFSSKWRTERSQVSMKMANQIQQTLLEKWKAVVDRIRKVKGFANFLQAISFATLRTVAAEGPVIIVNASRHRSDAIIVRDAEPPVIVPLSNASPDDLAPLSSKSSDSRVSSKASFSKDLCSILQKLWNIIASPVIEQLAVLGVAENTRIWWCPTSHLCALPLHAAGPYWSGRKSLPDLYISSYTPTLSALIAARSGIVPRTTTPSLLVIGDVGQPGSFIPNVEEELYRIMSFGDFVGVLFGEAANRDNVIFGLQQHSWAHFSCHGIRHPQPFHSSFQIFAGEHLTLLDLSDARLPNAELAFLSACHAAAAEVEGAPDEAIHLAGDLQTCGFQSVVETMWAMADIDGPDVAGNFYRYMFCKTGHAVDFRDSAKAINVATRTMRRRKDMTLGRWANFIHIGA